MCEPFTIRSWADPTREYILRDIEKFREIYEPQGFYVAGSGPHSFRRQRALAQRQQNVTPALADTQETDDTARNGTDDEPAESIPTPADAVDTRIEPARQRKRPASR